MGGSDRKDDARAVRLCLDGDRNAFAELVERYQREIALYCHSQVLDASVAEELAQDTFLRAFERLRQLNCHDHFRAWVYRIAATTVVTHGRRRREELMDTARHEDMTTGEVEQYNVDRHNDMREIAEEALRQLPEETRAAVVLRICEDMSYKEIAARLHIEPAAAESRARRGLRLMRVYLRRAGREEDVLDLLRYGIAGALLGSDIVAAVMERIAGMPDPRNPNSRDKDMRAAAALGLALVSAVFVAIGSATTGAGGSDAPNAGLRAASMVVTPVSEVAYPYALGPLGRETSDDTRGALYDFESGDLTGWTGRHFNRRLDRFHAVADDVLHVQKHTLDNPVIPGSRGLRFMKQDKGAYLLSALTSPPFGPFTEAFVAEWDVLLGDDNYGMYLSETLPGEADSEAQVTLAGVYFSGDTLTAMTDGYPRIGGYTPDSLFHVRVDARPQERLFSVTVAGDVMGRDGARRGAVHVEHLPFAAAYGHTGVRHLVFVMGRAAVGQYNLESQMILDNVTIRPAEEPERDVLAQGSIP